MIKETETNVSNSICEYLEAKRYFFWRQNTVGVYDAKSKSFRKKPKYSMNGVSDIILVYKGSVHFIEVKTKVGKQSKEQKAFEEKVLDNGGFYRLVTGIDDMIKLGY